MGQQSVAHLFNQQILLEYLPRPGHLKEQKYKELALRGGEMRLELSRGSCLSLDVSQVPPLLHVRN